MQISRVVTAQLISASIFAIKTVSTIPLLPKSEISSLLPSSVAVQIGFLSDLVGNPKDRFSHDTALEKTCFHGSDLVRHNKEENKEQAVLF